MSDRIIPIFIPHLGCPQDCVFCNQRSIAAPHEPSEDEVAGMIERALTLCGDGAELAFYGGSFTAIGYEKMTGYLRAAEPFVRDGRLCGIRVSTRPDCISPGILELLKNYGVKTVEIGAQSCDDEVLALSARGHTFADTVRASGMIKDAGLSLVLQMMIGLPGETDETPMENARKLAVLGPDGARIYPVVVVRGTGLERMWRDGKYQPLTPERAAELAAGPLEYFELHGIRVIRVGLNPTEDLSGGEALAGAYHPALGEMTRSVILLRRMRERLRAAAPKAGAEVTFLVPKGRGSAAVGQHRRNVEALCAEFRLARVRVREDVSLAGYEVRLA